MARLLAIEWDAREARVAVATRRGRDAVIEQAFAIDLLPKKQTDGKASTEKVGDVDIGHRLKEALTARGLHKVETLVAVGRANIELRVLNVPAAPDDELPDMVRFQAMQQFASIGEDWPLDYVPLDKSSDGGQSVLAAAIAPALVAQIRSTCETATLEPQRLVLRPFAAASLLRRRTDDQRCRLMVDVLTDEADLSVLADGNVVFLRTVRLPASHDGPDGWRPLLGEIRRTISAAQSQLGNRRVEVVTLCGDEHDHRELKTAVAQQLSLEVESFNPFVGPVGRRAARTADELPLSMSGALSLTKEALKAFPENPGRFAPLLGLLAVEAAGDRHAIDFLHPRKRPPPPSKRRRTLILAGGAAALLLAGGVMLFASLSSLDSEIAQKNKQSLEMDAKVKKANVLRDRVEKVDEFVRGDVVWLEKLRKLSNEFPPADQALVTQLVVNAGGAQGGGQARVECAAKQISTIDAIERQLREKGNQVSGTGAQREERLGDYGWKSTETIVVPPPDEEDVPSPSSSPSSLTAPKPSTAPGKPAGRPSTQTPPAKTPTQPARGGGGPR